MIPLGLAQYVNMSLECIVGSLINPGYPLFNSIPGQLLRPCELSR
jgi:hypothetical protein